MKSAAINDNNGKKDPAAAHIASIAEAFTDEMANLTVCGEVPYVQPGRSGDMADSVTCRVSVGNVEYDFIYTVGMPLGGKRSTLEIRIYFSDISDEIGLSMYDIVGELDADNFRCYIYPLIESPERMRLIVRGLVAETEKYSGQINAMAEDGRARDIIENKKQQIISLLHADDIFRLGGEEDRESAIAVYNSWYAARMTSGVFECYAKGKPKRAMKYAARSDATEYEVRLGGYIERTGGSYPSPCFDGCNTFSDFEKTEKKSSAGSFGRFMLSWAALVPLFFIAFLGLYYIIALICSRGALYSTALEFYNAVNVLLPAMLTAIAVSYFPAERMELKSKNESLRNYQLMLTSKRTRGCMTALANVMAVLSILFTVIMARTGVIVMPDGIVDSSGFSVKNDFYPYESVAAVECEKLPDEDIYGSVRIILRSGSTVELGYAACEPFDEKIAPVFKERGIDVFVFAAER